MLSEEQIFPGKALFSNIAIHKANHYKRTPLKKQVLLPTILVFGIFTTIKAQQPSTIVTGTSQKASKKILPRCSTMEIMQEAIQRDPTLPEKWRIEGERQYKLYLERQQRVNIRAEKAQGNPIIIPIVFHLVDDAATLASISDRDIIEQVEILNRDYGGKKLDQYTTVIPPEIATRVGRIPINLYWRAEIRLALQQRVSSAAPM